MQFTKQLMSCCVFGIHSISTWMWGRSFLGSLLGAAGMLLVWQCDAGWVGFGKIFRHETTGRHTYTIMEKSQDRRRHRHTGAGFLTGNRKFK